MDREDDDDAGEGGGGKRKDGIFSFTKGTTT